MYDAYAIAIGPLFVASLSLFLGGIFYRVISILLLARKTEQFVFTYINFRYSIRSVLHWILPFASLNWRLNPVLTTVTFIFHICCIVTPLFLLSHVVLLEETLNLSWWTLPDAVSDVMTIIVIASLIFFFIRRISFKKIKFVTSIYDYLLLLILAVPFFTGFVAYHQWMAYDVFIMAHILSSEALLIIIPHTRLGHMFLFFLTRSYAGSEFGKVRNVKDW